MPAALLEAPPVRTQPPLPARPLRRIRLSALDRTVLRTYVLTRAGLLVTAYCVARLFPARPDDKQARPLLSVWQQWDWAHYRTIAEYGYFHGADNTEAFFPGFPLVLRAVHVVVPDWTLAGLLISFVSGGVAMLALARIAGPLVGGRAVLLLLLSPCAVFLAAGYTESLFLALALPAWLAARRGNWALAAALTAAATAVRVSGLFLAAALLVQFLVAHGPGRRWRRLPWLALPAVPALAYTAYLHARTGDWMAWKHAQERGWYRTFHWPWEAWANTWNAASEGTYATGYALLCQAELVAMLLGLGLFAWLLRGRRWAEAAYVALTLWALGTSYWYTSIPRATLLWWPLWAGLAAWTLRSQRATYVCLCVLAPLSTLYAVAFLSGRWAG
ncbi:mannosyltransferase family protein [Streptomyces kunmingensis]|uniref:Mannosyltransferase family protein n=1 Tax=Streptomyces kunmingensis TaxID=68225 RepID=A0ABU6C2T4_9ACTN|nr:mannosyltransferase family protein [Streptomyces kunmingensis]MEB3959020.1 mannosyltransferase family protein [Streptomyces kunmingensis]